MIRVPDSPLDRAISKLRSLVLKSQPGARKFELMQLIDELEKCNNYQAEYEQALYVQGFADGYKTRQSKYHGSISNSKGEFVVGRQESSIQGGERYISRYSSPT